MCVHFSDAQVCSDGGFEKYYSLAVTDMNVFHLIGRLNSSRAVRSARRRRRSNRNPANYCIHNADRSDRRCCDAAAAAHHHQCERHTAYTAEQTNKTKACVRVSRRVGRSYDLACVSVHRVHNDVARTGSG